MLKGWIRIRIRINRQGIATGLELAAVFYTARICPMIWGLLKAFFSSIFFVRWRLLRFLLDSFDVSEFNSVYSTALKVQIKTYHPKDSCNVYSSFVNVVNVVSVVNVVNAVNVVVYT